MSPKKGIQSNRKSTEKTRTVRKVKAQLNKPANFKINIPLKISTEEAGLHVPIIKGRRPPQFTKQLDNKTKVELANSVARQQLVKEEPPVFQLDNLVYIKEPKTRGRKKKVVSHFFPNCLVVGKNSAEAVVTSTGTKLPEDLTPAKKKTPEKQAPTRRILTRKRLADSKAQDAKRIKVEPNPELESLVVKLEGASQVNEFAKPVEAKCDPVVKLPTTVVQKTPQLLVARPDLEPTKPQPSPNKTTPKLPQSARKRPTVRQPAHPRMKRGPKGKQQNVRPSTATPARVELLNLKNLEAEEKTKQNTPGLVGSRNNSVSSCSNKSWTREISSSSNTTCIGSVGSNDFVCIDNKLPVLKLTNIDNVVKKHQQVATATADVTSKHLSDQYDSDSSDSESKSSIQFNDSLSANSLLLSSPSTQFTQPQRRESTTDYAKAARELSFRIKRCDIEIINWMGSENEHINANLLKLKNKISETFLNEFGTITNCRRLKEILEPPNKEDYIPNDICISDRVQDCKANNGTEQTQVKEDASVQKHASAEENTQAAASALVKENPIEPFNEFVTPRRTPSRKLSSTSEGNNSNASTKNDTSDDEVQPGTSNTYYNHHDDDDALSLFAESITGFESSKMNTWTASAVASKPRPVEEYIPQPVRDDPAPNTEKHIYYPTKIAEGTEVMTSKIATVCEKQNADSTSIFKQSNSTDDAESYHTDYTENIDLDTRLGPSDTTKKPVLMSSFFEGLPKVRSVVFGKLCFYNLMNSCRKIYYGQCRFVHLIPTSEQIKEKLSLLDDRMVIQEYLLLRNWYEIRRRYGMCYVEECVKRGLTRILVEMAYDFIVKARNDSEEDTRLRVNTIEHTLLHLNNVDLNLCDDLLKLPILSEQGNRTLLCDVLMATMSITQNFSRFKDVFLNLTYFMVNNDRTFNKDVVEHIMERVCILPFEESIAKAVIQMMRSTNSDIFNNSMSGHFEKQISVNKDVFEEYTLLKNQCAFTSMLASSVMTASSPLSLDTVAARGDAAPDATDPQPPAASPDTTNLDNMHKTVEEPSKTIITRTIGMNPPITSNQATPSCGDSRGHVATDSDTSDDSVKQNIRTWRNRTIFPHKLPPPMLNRPPMRGMPVRAMRPPMRPHMRPPPIPFNQRLVTFRSPSSFVNRHPGPKY